MSGRDARHVLHDRQEHQNQAQHPEGRTRHRSGLEDRINQAWLTLTSRLYSFYDFISNTKKRIGTSSQTSFGTGDPLKTTKNNQILANPIKLLLEYSVDA